jgi:hypothetical protein
MRIDGSENRNAWESDHHKNFRRFQNNYVDLFNLINYTL